MKKQFFIIVLLLLGYNGFTQDSTNTILIPKNAVDLSSGFIMHGQSAILSESGAIYSNENRYEVRADVTCYDKTTASMTVNYFKAQTEEEYNGKKVKCCFKVSSYNGGQLASWQGAEYFDKEEKENLKQANLVWEGMVGNCVVVLRVAMDTENKARSYLDVMISKAKGIDFTKL